MEKHNQGGKIDENKTFIFPIEFKKTCITLANHTTSIGATVENSIKPNGLNGATIVTSTTTNDGISYWGSLGV